MSEQAERLVLKLEGRALAAEFTGGKIDLERAKADDSGSFGLFMFAHIPFILSSLIIHPGVH